MKCVLLNEQRDKYPDDGRMAIIETIRICVDQGVLKEYLLKRSEEVVNIMLTLFTQQQAHDMEILNERKEAKAEGLAEGKAEGLAEGLVQGKLQGEEEAKRSMAEEMYHEMNMSVEVIAGLVKRSVETVKEWLGIKAV